MKLYYWQPSKATSNFGDELNVWLWNQLIPDILDDDETSAFVGIGTLLNDVLVSKTPTAQRRVVFSSGVGYGNSRQFSLDDSYKVYCVRGPLSAQRLGLDESFGIVDGALLTKKLVTTTACRKKYSFSYMPHLSTMRPEMADACRELGYGYIPPTLPVEEVFQRLAETEVVIAEAMHGAIAADALRIPWIPVATHQSINKFKWTDWCSSIGLAYNPVRIELKRYQAHLGNDLLTPIRKVRNQAFNYAYLKENIIAFKQLANPRLACLSQEHLQDELIERLEEKIALFRQDYEAQELMARPSDMQSSFKPYEGL